MSRKYTLLTGSTGQIGRVLLRDLLRGQRDRVAVLVRPKDGRSGRQRIEELLEHWRESSGEDLPVPVCLEGDTTLQGFGLGQADRHWLRGNCDTVLHNAAMLDFSGGGTNQTLDNNIAGAQRTLQVCRELRIEHLAYTSTAYVCGTRGGTVYEHELEMGQAFRNEYEQSKYEAERIIRGPSQLDQVTVMRPAIVVGDYHTGRTFSYHSFYRAAQFTAAFAAAADKDERGFWTHDVRLTWPGEGITNFVTVDWVSAAMAKIVSTPECFGKTYHLTPSRPTTWCEVEQALQECFCYTGVQFVDAETIDLHAGSPEERRFYEYMEDYADYWRDEPRFDRTATDLATADIPDPRIDVPCLVRLIHYAVKTRFGKLQRNRRRVNNRRRASTA